MTGPKGNASRAPALLLVGHGSRDDGGVEQFWELAARLRAMAPDLDIACGFIEFASPSLDSAIDSLVADGAAEIVAVPLVLLGAGHLKDDGPAALAEGRARHPAVGFLYGRDLGVHPQILAVAEERARSALRVLAGRAATESGTDATAAAVVVVGRGSTDPDANADLYKAARLLADRRRLTGAADLDEVVPAFVSLAPPSVEEALSRAHRLGANLIAVVPYFLFTGILVDRIRAQAAEWAAHHPHVSVTVGEELGPDLRIAALALERYREALKGDARMNCDGCLYRSKLPGYEHRLHAPLPNLARSSPGTE
jgi:sirohydrochlorin ferrochelatase